MFAKIIDAAWVDGGTFGDIRHKDLNLDHMFRFTSCRTQACIQRVHGNIKLRHCIPWDCAVGAHTYYTRDPDKITGSH